MVIADVSGTTNHCVHGRGSVSSGFSSRSAPTLVGLDLRTCAEGKYVGEMRDRTAKFLSGIHTTLYRITSGVVGRRLVNNDMLLLTTTGRHTGTAHTVPLLYLSDDDRYVVFASWGGRDQHPEWYLNLLADPRGVVQVRSQRRPVTALTAEGDERGRLWSRAEVAYSGYAEYQARTDRQIPVVLLTPD